MSGPLLGAGKRGRHPPKQNSPSPNCPAYPPKLSLPLRQFQVGVFFFGNQPRPQRKVDHIGAMTILFWISTKNWVKTRPTQKFWLFQKQFLPLLEQRSSCGIDMCVKKIVPHRPKASPHVTAYNVVQCFFRSVTLIQELSDTIFSMASRRKDTITSFTVDITKVAISDLTHRIWLITGRSLYFLLYAVLRVADETTL